MGAPARISEERLLGYQGSLADAGIAPDSALVALGDFTEAGGHDAMRSLLAAAPDLTAVFAANDLSAIGAMSAIAASRPQRARRHLRSSASTTCACRSTRRRL